MRVLLVTDDLPRIPRGGADRHVAELAVALRERDVEGIVLKLAEGEAERMARLNQSVSPAPTAEAVEGARNHPVSVSWGDASDGENGLIGSISNRPLLAAFEEALERLQPDVVHVHSLQHLSHRIPEKARTFGARVVWTMHDFFAICPRTHLHKGDLGPCDGPDGGVACGPCFGGLKGLLAAPLYALRHVGFLAAHRTAHAIVAPSRYLADVMVAQGALEHRVHVLPPAVPRSPRMAELATDPHRVRFVYAGDLRAAKGPDLAIEAVRRLRDQGVEGIELAIHGGSPAPPAPPESAFEERLRAAAADLDVTFHGRYADEDLIHHLDGAAALLVPSRVRETFGRTANRALQTGVPVVAAAHGALPEFVQEGVNGALFAPGDAGALAEAMSRIIDQGLTMQSDVDDWPEAPDLSAHVDGLLPLYDA